MNIRHIACSIDDNYIEQLFAFLTSIFKNNKEQNFHIFILSEHLEKSNTIIIKKFFLDYPSNIFEFVFLDPTLLDGVIVFGHVSRATYFRILLANVLPNQVTKVLYLDVDIIIKGKLAPLWEYNIENDSHLAVENLCIDDDYKLNLGISKSSVYFNAGVLMINLTFWRKHNIYEKSIQFIKNNPEKIILWDQDVLNVVLENQWKELPYTYNAQEIIFRIDKDKNLEYNFLNSFLNPKIIHFTGGGHSKPWFKECRHCLKNEYGYYLYLSKFSRSPIWIRVLNMDIKLSQLTLPLLFIERLLHQMKRFYL